MLKDSSDDEDEEDDDDDVLYNSGSDDVAVPILDCYSQPAAEKVFQIPDQLATSICRRWRIAHICYLTFATSSFKEELQNKLKAITGSNLGM